MFPGSILGGFFADKFTPYCRLIVAISLDIMAVATAAVPWSPNVWGMWSLYFVIGILESIVNIGKYKSLIGYYVNETSLEWVNNNVMFIQLIYLPTCYS